QSGQTNLKYHVAATDLARLGALVNQPDLSGSAILDGTVTGNASSLTLNGKLDGSGLGYQTSKALDLNSTYAVTIPDLDVTRAHVQADNTATFVQIGSFQLNAVTATTTYEGQTLDFKTHRAEAPDKGARELD